MHPSRMPTLLPALPAGCVCCPLRPVNMWAQYYDKCIAAIQEESPDGLASTWDC